MKSASSLLGSRMLATTRDSFPSNTGERIQKIWRLPPSFPSTSIPRTTSPSSHFVSTSLPSGDFNFSSGDVLCKPFSLNAKRKPFNLNAKRQLPRGMQAFQPQRQASTSTRHRVELAGSRTRWFDFDSPIMSHGFFLLSPLFFPSFLFSFLCFLLRLPSERIFSSFKMAECYDRSS